MKLTSLKLANFRSYTELDFRFPEEDLVILTGDNGHGKTSFLESIYMLALAKSFSGQNRGMITTFSADFTRITGEFRTTNREETQEMFWQIRPTAELLVSIRGIPQKIHQYVGNMLVVLYRPEDIEIISGSPVLRRKYINTLLSQIDNQYLRNLVEFQALIRQRNALLAAIAENSSRADELLYWNDQLAHKGAFLFARRRAIGERINALLPHYYSSIAGKPTTCTLQWKYDISSDPQESFTWYSSKIADTVDRDIAARTTLSGPHRDEFYIMCGQRNMQHYGSRGEQRSAVLALKMAEMDIIRELTGEHPIVLLDDILSECDQARQKNILTLMRECQTILTSAQEISIPSKGRSYRVTTGRISG